MKRPVNNVAATLAARMTQNGDDLSFLYRKPQPIPKRPVGEALAVLGAVGFVLAVCGLVALHIIG